MERVTNPQRWLLLVGCLSSRTVASDAAAVVENGQPKAAIFVPALNELGTGGLLGPVVLDRKSN